MRCTWGYTRRARTDAPSCHRRKPAPRHRLLGGGAAERARGLSGSRRGGLRGDWLGAAGSATGSTATLVSTPPPSNQRRAPSRSALHILDHRCSGRNTGERVIRLASLFRGSDNSRNGNRAKGALVVCRHGHGTRHSSLGLGTIGAVARTALCAGALGLAAFACGDDDADDSPGGGGTGSGATSAGGATSSGGGSGAVSGGTSGTGTTGGSGGGSSGAMSGGGTTAGAGGTGGGGGGGNAGDGGMTTGGSSGAGTGGTNTGGQAGSGGQTACMPACSGGRRCCEGECVDLESDPRHCGACGIECSEDTPYCLGSCMERPCVGTACSAGETCCGIECCSGGEVCCPSPTSLNPTCTQPVNGTCPPICEDCG